MHFEGPIDVFLVHDLSHPAQPWVNIISLLRLKRKAKVLSESSEVDAPQTLHSSCTWLP